MIDMDGMSGINICIKELTFTYPGANAPCLKNISLTIEKGEFIAIAGNNGSGKSTLLKIMNGLIPHFVSGDLEGSAVVNGKEASEWDIGMLSRKIGFVYQDFENQIICPTVLEDVSFACLNYALPEHLERGKEALSAVGLSHKEDDYVWQLSGGEKHLLALGGVIALAPDIYILDEPAAQLDFAYVRRIYNILRNLNEKHGKTIIVAEHHTELIAEYCKQMVLMENGELLWKRPVKEALVMTDTLMRCHISPPQVTQAALLLQKIGKLEAGCRLPTTIEEGVAVFSSILPPHFNNATNVPGRPMEVCVRFTDVEVVYRSIQAAGCKIFDGLSLELFKTQKTALVGRNGSGKSTLLKLLMGIIRASVGSIVVDGHVTKKMPIEALAQKISLVLQNSEEMFITDSVKNDIELALKAHSIENYAKKTEELLSLLNLSDVGDKDGRLLSGGQMRRASIAIGIAMNPPILLLDEPTSNLDISSRNNILCALDKLDGIVQTIVIATHDMQLVSQWADRIIVLSDGAVVADGSRVEIFSDKQLMASVGIEPPSIYLMGKALDPAINCFTAEEFSNLFGKDDTGA